MLRDKSLARAEHCGSTARMQSRAWGSLGSAADWPDWGNSSRGVFCYKTGSAARPVTSGRPFEGGDHEAPISVVAFSEAGDANTIGDGGRPCVARPAAFGRDA